MMWAALPVKMIQGCYFYWVPMQLYLYGIRLCNDSWVYFIHFITHRECAPWQTWNTVYTVDSRYTRCNRIWGAYSTRLIVMLRRDGIVQRPVGKAESRVALHYLQWPALVNFLRVGVCAACGSTGRLRGFSQPATDASTRRVS